MLVFTGGGYIEILNRMFAKVLVEINGGISLMETDLTCFSHVYVFSCIHHRKMA